MDGLSVFTGFCAAVRVMWKWPGRIKARIIKSLSHEAAFKKAEMAANLGCPSCYRHDDPVVMKATEKQNVFKCPECGSEKITGPACVGRDPDPHPRCWEKPGWKR